MKYEKIGENLVITIPLWQEINNPYMDDKNLPQTANLIGVIAGDEFTISHLNDLDYKGTQQEGMPILYFGTREELEEVCKLCDIDIWEHPLCAYCGKAIRGVFTYSEKGNQCYDCEEKENPKTDL